MPLRGVNARLKLPLAVALGYFGRYVVAALSGVVFFAEYAGDQEALVCAVIAPIPAMGRLPEFSQSPPRRLRGTAFRSPRPRSRSERSPGSFGDLQIRRVIVDNDDPVLLTFPPSFSPYPARQPFFLLYITAKRHSICQQNSRAFSFSCKPSGFGGGEQVQIFSFSHLHRRNRLRHFIQKHLLMSPKSARKYLSTAKVD